MKWKAVALVSGKDSAAERLQLAHDLVAARERDGRTRADLASVTGASDAALERLERTGDGPLSLIRACARAAHDDVRVVYAGERLTGGSDAIIAVLMRRLALPRYSGDAPAAEPLLSTLQARADSRGTRLEVRLISREREQRIKHSVSQGEQQIASGLAGSSLDNVLAEADATAARRLDLGRPKKGPAR